MALHLLEHQNNFNQMVSAHNQFLTKNTDVILIIYSSVSLLSNEEVNFAGRTNGTNAATVFLLIYLISV
jgi:hypothetical protein